jgi:hypothetical protein
MFANFNRTFANQLKVPFLAGLLLNELLPRNGSQAVNPRVLIAFSGIKSRGTVSVFMTFFGWRVSKHRATLQFDQST